MLNLLLAYPLYTLLGNVINYMIYFISFLVLFFAEVFGTLRDIYLLKQNKHLQALFNGMGSALWCVKIVVVISQPLSILTGFLGAYLGSYFAFWLEHKFIKRITP